MTLTTLDMLYAGKLQLKQHKSGYRFGVDSVLLATFAQPGHERTLDLGTGAGVVALQLWYEGKSERVTGLEVQPSLARLAHANIALNGAGEACEVVEGDLRDKDLLKSIGSFDRVVMNPPYWPVSAGRLPPNEEKAIAKHKLLGGLEEWILAASRALTDGGVLEMVYPCERLADLMVRAVHHRLQPIYLTLVHSQPKAEAIFALVRCKKGSNAPLTVSAPWVIFNRVGKPHSRYLALSGQNVLR